MIEQQKIKRVFQLIKSLHHGNGKTLAQIMDQIEVSRATAFRYLDLLKSLDYEIIEKNGLYKIETYSDVHKFTKEEKKVLVSLINGVEKKRNIHENIINKIKAFGAEYSSEQLLNLKRIQIADRLVDAAKHKMAISLKNYKSTNAESIDRDRNVIAIEYDEDSSTLLSYDLEVEGFKLYKLTRIENIDLLEINFNHELPNSLPMLDKFGWSSNKKIKIELELTSRAKALLEENFPSTSECITKINKNPFEWKYKDTVCGYPGIGRFVLGLCEDVRIVKDEGFKEFIKEKMKRQTLI